MELAPSLLLLAPPYGYLNCTFDKAYTHISLPHGANEDAASDGAHRLAASIGAREPTANTCRQSCAHEVL